MEIEIVTTKKKLTKSLIQQMREIQLDEIMNANVLGFINDNPVIILLELNRFEYRKMYIGWKPSSTYCLYRKLGKYTVEKKFKEEEHCKLYYDKMCEFKQEAIQIYI